MTLNGTPVVGADAAHATTIINNTTGTLTAWYDAGTSEIHYTYKLLDNTGDTNNTAINVAVGVTDVDGDPSPAGNLTITTFDDAPHAVSLATQNVAEGATANRAASSNSPQYERSYGNSGERHELGVRKRRVFADVP